MQCKLRWVNFGRVLDPRREFLRAFGVTWISDNWYKSTMGVIVISLVTPRSASDDYGCIWEHLGAPVASLGPQRTSLSAYRCTGDKYESTDNNPGSADDKPGRTDDKSITTSNHSRAVLGKQNLLWDRCWCVWKSKALHQQIVNWYRSSTQSSQTLWATSPVLLSTSSCSQTPLELNKVLTESAWAFSGAPESTCS